MQHIQVQLDKVQHWLQQDLRSEPVIRNARQSLFHRVQQMESRIVNRCKALEKLIGVLEGDVALPPRVLKWQEDCLEDLTQNQFAPERFTRINRGSTRCCCMRGLNPQRASSISACLIKGTTSTNTKVDWKHLWKTYQKFTLLPK